MKKGTSLLIDGKQWTVIGTRYSALKRVTLIVLQDEKGKKMEIDPKAQPEMAAAVEKAPIMEGVPGKDAPVPQRGVHYWTKSDIDQITKEATAVLKASFRQPLDGEDGKPGEPGKPGENGKTPKAGIDYPTKAEMLRFVVSEVSKIPKLEGTPGKDGKVPAHKWEGTKLFFQNPDGKWGEGIDLKGRPGDGGDMMGGSGGAPFIGQVKTTVSDETPGFLGDKLKAGSNVTITEITENGVKKYQISSTGGGGGGGAVDSVNGETGVVVLDADDIDDTSTTNKFVTAAEKSSIALIAGKADDSAVVHKTGAEDINGNKNLLADFWNFSQNFALFGKLRTTDGAGYQFQLAAGDAKGEAETGGGMQISAGNADFFVTEGIGGNFDMLAGFSRGSADGGSINQIGGSAQDGNGGHSTNKGGQSNGAGIAGEGRIEGADGASGDQNGGHVGARGGAPSGSGLWGRFYIKTQALFSGFFNGDGLTADRNYTLPDNDGTIALTSQIPDTSLFFDRVHVLLGASATAGSTQNTDYIYDIPDETYVLTLDNANSVGDNFYYIKNSSTGVASVDTSSSNTFDGVVAPYLLQPGESILIHSNGFTDWRVLAKHETVSMGTVVHGADDTVARPSGYASVTWIGSVEPTNAIDNDTWINTA